MVIEHKCKAYVENKVTQEIVTYIEVTAKGLAIYILLSERG